MPSPAKNLVGRQIALLRSGLTMSQAEFAAHCQLSGWDISRETLAKIESGIRCVTDVEVVEIAEALKVPATDLFPIDKRHLFVQALKA